MKKGTIIDLPVKEIRKADRRSFYVVELCGKEHAIGMFPFQKDDPQPDKIQCMIKDIHEGEPIVIQNFAPLLEKLYTEGKTYPFWVRRDCTQVPNGYYEVADWNGFCFRLMFYGNAKLNIRQRIECRVKSLRDYRLCLELVRHNAKDRGLPFLTHDEVLESVGASSGMIRWLKRKFLILPLFSEARNLYLNDKGEWILSFISHVEKKLRNWMRTNNKHLDELLDVYRKVCLYLLEDSNFLSNCPEQERISHQCMFSNVALRAEEYLEALRMIERNEHLSYIEVLLQKLEKSGYLYQSGKKLRTLKCIFTLEPEMMRESMPAFFDIIRKGNKDNWIVEPFRSAFVQLLELFISENRNRVDHRANVDEMEGKLSLEGMITALSIQLLLINDKDDIDWRLRRSMLYRYLTYLKCTDTQVLFDKAFYCLSDTSRKELEFGWREVNDLTLLGIQLSHPLSAGHNERIHSSQVYEGKNAQLRIINGNIQILPLGGNRRLHSVLPDWLLKWRSMDVLLSDPLTQEVKKDTNDLAVYQKMWREVEYALFNSGEETPQVVTSHKMRPEVGDKVTIRVLKQDLQHPDYFHCLLEDEMYEGRGRLHVRNMARYNFQTDISTFCNDEGNPFLLKAEVLNVLPDGTYNLGLQGVIGTFIHQNVMVGSDINCLVTDSLHGNIVCVSEFGYSVYVPDTSEAQELRPGDYIEAKISHIRSNGTVYAEFTRRIVAAFSVNEAFSDLIYNYADEQIYVPVAGKEEERLAEVMMEHTYVTELMHIIDRVAMMDKDYLNTYNFLGVARILALLLGKGGMAKYYTERMKLLQMLQQFAINGQINTEKLKEQERINGDMVKNYPLLKNRLTELETIGCIDCPGKNEFLWKMSVEAKDDRLSSIARLVLAYNLMDGFDMYEQKEMIRKKINDILNITLHYEKPMYFGREDQHTEFKSSLVFPANTMRADLPRQTSEIMKVICGFLNAEGGTLYMGVNNEGVACGLDNDLEYFGGSIDKFDLHLRNNIVSYMGKDANARVSVSYPSASKHMVYALAIKPSPRPVQCEGIYYQRQGSSTWPLLGEEELEDFLRRRKEEATVSEASSPQSSTDTVEACSVSQSQSEEMQPVVEEAVSETTVPPRDYSLITTSQIRPNAIHSWEEGFGEDTLCYLHLLTDNRYMLSDSESWRNDILLSLAVYEQEDYLVVVYASGRITRIPIGELTDKTYGKEYKRYSDDALVFVCPARKEDALLTVMEDVQNRPSYRMDDVVNLKAGTMKTKGDTLSNIEINGVIQCEIIPAGKKEALKRIHNMRNTNIGINLNVMYGSEELEALKGMGITLLDEK